MAVARSVAAALLAAVGLCLSVQGAGASANGRAAEFTHLPRASTMPLTDRASTPWGWADFCERYASECVVDHSRTRDIELTSKVWDLLREVNDKVNHSVRPMSDQDHWGVVDQWDLPLDGYGDCEDYALLKRKLLIEAGLPRQALLMTVVKDEHGDGHAILTAATSRGDFVLDNMSETIKAWEATPYTFVKRQSREDPNLWDQIGEPTAAPLIVSR